MELEECEPYADPELGWKSYSPQATWAVRLVHSLTRRTRDKARYGLFCLFFQLFLLLFFFLRVSYSTGWPQTSYVTKDDPELLIFLLLCPPYQDDSQCHHAWLGGQNPGLRGCQVSAAHCELPLSLCCFEMGLSQSPGDPEC